MEKTEVKEPSKPQKKRAPFKRGEILDLTPEKITLDGKTVCKVEDFVVFVKSALPGQTVKAQITRIKEKYAEAKIIEVIKRSQIEVKPKCQHALTCGGCSWQTVPYEKQLELKEHAVRELLEIQGGLEKFTFIPIMPSPEIWEYRNKMEFSFGYEKMEVEEKDGKRVYNDINPGIGMHRRGKWETIVPLEECHLISNDLFAIVQVFKKLLRDYPKLKVYNPKTHQGFWRQLILREGKNTNEVMVNIVVSDKDFLLKGKGQRILNEIIVTLQKKKKVKSILLTENKGMSDFTGNLKADLLWGAPHIYDKIGDYTFKISPFSFFQTNTKGAEKLYQVISDFSELSGSENVLDLYCGTGTIGIYMASRAKWVYGVEMNKDAVADAQENAKYNHFPNTTFFAGMMEKTLHRFISRIESLDVVVVDPPRAGIHKKALETIIKSQPKKLIYVSCNPVTMLRDLKELDKQGYKLQKIQCIDMFPHTSHVETVALLLPQDS